METRSLRVLIVEDSEDDAYLIERQLRLHGYQTLCRRVQTAGDMKQALTEGAWDLIVSDYLLPSFNALGAIQIYKESGLDVPFIVISGSIGEEVAVETMKQGVHDYLMKDNLTRLPVTIDRELREAGVRRERQHLAEGLSEAVDAVLRHIRTTCESLLENPSSGPGWQAEVQDILDNANRGLNDIERLRKGRIAASHP